MSSLDETTTEPTTVVERDVLSEVINSELDSSSRLWPKFLAIGSVTGCMTAYLTAKYGGATAGAFLAMTAGGGLAMLRAAESDDDCCFFKVNCKNVGSLDKAAIAAEEKAPDIGGDVFDIEGDEFSDFIQKKTVIAAYAGGLLFGILLESAIIKYFAPK